MRVLPLPRETPALQAAGELLLKRSSSVQPGLFPPAGAVRLPWPHSAATLTAVWWGLTVAVCFRNN